MIRNPRARMLVSRLLQAVPVMILATFIVFSLIQLVPGSVAYVIAGVRASAQRIAEIREVYGLNEPFLVQYAQWLWQALQGNLGQSLVTGEPVWKTITRAYPLTLFIATYATILAIVIGVPLGIIAASRPHASRDSSVMGMASLGVATPNFWLGIVLVLMFSLRLNWFPATGFVPPGEDFLAAVWYATLPAIALGTVGIAEVARQTRGSLVELHGTQHVRTLHAKGLSPHSILWKHGLKNISVNLLTVIGLLFTKILAATVVVEAVFAIPGLGSAVVNAVLQSDFPVVQGAVLAMVVTVIFVNLATDLLCTIVDPRAEQQA